MPILTPAIQGVSMRALIALFFLSISGALAQSVPISEAEREEAIEGAAAQIEARFYDVELASEIAQLLRDAEAEGQFDSLTTRSGFALAVTNMLQPYDRHFRLTDTGAPEPSSGDSQDGPPPGGSPWAAGASINYGFERVERLPGNVGYIKFNGFFPAAMGGETAATALDFVKDTDALIFDVTDNGGGDPSMVMLLISHLLDPSEPILVNEFLFRNGDTTNTLPMMSLTELASIARPDVPVFITTSRRTASAAEGFSYHLQAMDRATIVGETTAGAGNPGGPVYAGAGFSIFVAVGSPRNPITGSNWEAVGVVPDHPAPRYDAATTAHALALDLLASQAGDDSQRRQLEWAAERARASLTGATLSVDDMAEYIGRYGPYALSLSNGRLVFGIGGMAQNLIVPVGDDRFMYAGQDDTQLVFERDGDTITHLLLNTADGRTETLPSAN